MRNFTIISAISLVLFVANTKAQGLAPLKLGNIWVYDEISHLSRTAVVDTSVYFDTIEYYKLYRELNYGGLQYYKYARLKEDGFYVLFDEFDSTETHIYYKKNAVIGDTWTIGGTTVYAIEDTFVANVFGEQTTIKFLTRDNGLVYIEEYWTEKFGKLSSSQFPNPWPTEELLGCVIDGVAYGDTTFTIVSVESEFETPNDFYLAQNYPNPFNPYTSIKFTLPEGSFMTLEVFNILGEKVKTLIKEFKAAGTHTIEFEANGLASGTYLYVLSSSNFTQAKKMQLIK